MSRRPATVCWIARAVSTRSNCMRRSVGALVVVEKAIIATGYNGTPEGLANCLDGGCLRCADRESFVPGTGYDLCICVHAEANALLTGQQVGQPQMPNFNTSQSTGGTNYLGAAGLQGQAALDAFNAKQAGFGGLMSGLGTLGAAGIMASDRRLKSNIVKVGEHPIGVGIYEYDIFGRRERGVIAQEVAKVAPELVHRGAAGYLHVDYRGL